MLLFVNIASSFAVLATYMLLPIYAPPYCTTKAPLAPALAAVLPSIQADLLTYKPPAFMLTAAVPVVD